MACSILRFRQARAKRDQYFLHSLVQLYRHHISALLEQRDVIMAKLSEQRDRRTVFADQKVEVLCYVPIQLMDDIAALEAVIQV